jgi:hypothetical protein
LQHEIGGLVEGRSGRDAVQGGEKPQILVTGGTARAIPQGIPLLRREKRLLGPNGRGEGNAQAGGEKTGEKT